MSELTDLITAHNQRKINTFEMEQGIKFLIAKIIDKVEPCEPDCTPERHAYHQGQWDMYQRQLKEVQAL